MNRQQMVINTIAFMKQIQEGKPQRAFLENLKGLGVQTVEVRQEYFMDLEEMRETGREASRLGVQLFYSVPQQLFVNGHVDREQITQTLIEAEALGVKAVKWTCGNFTRWPAEDLEWMKQTAETFTGLLTVENDQTAADGTVAKLLTFLEASRDARLNILCTFDVGNWAWVREDPLENARRLARYVGYIHLKDVVYVDGAPQATALGAGEFPLREALSVLPKDVPVALEYPCDENTFDAIDEGLKWLEQNTASSDH